MENSFITILQKYYVHSGHKKTILSNGPTIMDKTIKLQILTTMSVLYCRLKSFKMNP